MIFMVYFIKANIYIFIYYNIYNIIIIYTNISKNIKKIAYIINTIILKILSIIR